VPHFECKKLYGAWLADFIRASGHACRIQRPDTRLQTPTNARSSRKSLPCGRRPHMTLRKVCNFKVLQFIHYCNRLRTRETVLFQPAACFLTATAGRSSRLGPSCERSKLRMPRRLMCLWPIGAMACSTSAGYAPDAWSTAS
jgi:hypothetical protein